MSWQNSSLQGSSEGFSRKAVTHWVRLKEGQERKWKYLLVSLKSQQRQLELQVNMLVQQWNEPHSANERSAFLCSGHGSKWQLQGLHAALWDKLCCERSKHRLWFPGSNPQESGIACCQMRGSIRILTAKPKWRLIWKAAVYGRGAGTNISI